ncbi:MAG: HPF/RaiA family ribosome-associated protein [Cyanobacteria bacterium J06623_5]
MKVAPEISYRGVNKTDALEALIAEKIDKLEQVYDRLNSCRVAIERAHNHPDSGSPYRVRLDITAPESREVAVDISPDQGVQYPPLEAVIRDAFDAARRQLKELNERQKSQVDRHGANLREVVIPADPLEEVAVPPADVVAE